MNNVIFLDFDGVLFDTVFESYLLARYAYYDISPFDRVDENEYKIFHQNRYLITNSWQYYYIMKIIGDRHFNNVEEFKIQYLNYFDNREVDNEKRFDEKFQNMRKELIEKHYDFWSKLDKPYPFLEKIKTVNSKLKIFILSTKNKSAIMNKLKDYKYNIPEENIIGKDTLKNYKSKGEFLSEFIKNMNIQNAIFIDDSKENLDSCINVNNLNCFLAGWGYTADTGYTEDEIIKKIEEIL